MTTKPIDFTNIRTLNGSQATAFEELCCHLAHSENIPFGSSFERYEGAGGDGGVECIWRLPNGSEWGWQVKYVFSFAKTKGQFDNSVRNALETHPKLVKYTFCIPFNPTGKTKARSEGQQSQIEQWKQEWQTLAAQKGMKVEFEVLVASQLANRILASPSSSGRVAYWFDKTFLTKEWFAKSVAEVQEAVKPRYSPLLNVEVPVRKSFEAFGRTQAWHVDTQDLLLKLRRHISDWKHCYELPDFDGKADFPDAARVPASELTKKLQQIDIWLQQYIASSEAAGLGDLPNLLNESAMLAAECVSITKDELSRKHGKNVIENVPWRQFMSEYQVSFPARHFDTAGELRKFVEELHSWSIGVNQLVVLPYSRAMLLTGAAWMGKTHSICDIAKQRLGNGQLSLVLLGQHFHDEDPWTQIIRRLGLPSGLSRDTFLGALDEAAAISGFPAIIFIDALNESRPRGFWRDHLCLFLEQATHYPNIKVCVSCRSSYLEDTLPDGLSLPKVEHTGFAGIEYDAFKDFFEFYELEAPAFPLLQPEYRNPGFLKLLCESLRDDGHRQLPREGRSLLHVVRLFLSAKNKKAAQQLSYNPREQIVQKAFFELVDAMVEDGSRWLRWDAAQQRVASILQNHQHFDLFDLLLKEQLLLEDRRFDGETNQDGDFVTFSFERFADYLIADRLCQQVTQKDARASFKKGGDLHYLVESVVAIRENRGVLEALAIILPEKAGIELPDVVDNAGLANALLPIFLDSVPWRSSQGDWNIAIKYILNALQNDRMYRQCLEVLVGCCTRDDLPVNAEWLHGYLSKLRLVERDEKLSPWLHLSYGTNWNVDAIIRLALEGSLRSVHEKTLMLWAVTLLWLCSASDRRVRDAATMALVRIVETMPQICPTLFERFLSCDDDYVMERLVVASYGGLLRSGNDDGIRAMAEVLQSHWFSKGMPHQNVQIRDTATAIMELARHRGLLPNGMMQADYKFPFKSPWPLNFPTQDEVDQYKDTFWELPKLHQSCFDDDFYTYTLSHRMDDYEGMNRADAARWIFMQVLRTGYERSGVKEFDAYLVNKYGPGRSKPEWAERVGKKYQWIMLFRLQGILSDNCKRSKDCYWSDGDQHSPFVSLGGRTIDPTIITKRDQSRQEGSWWMPVGYNHSQSAYCSHIEWLKLNDLPDTLSIVSGHSTIGNPNLVLQASLEWSSRTSRTDEDKEYRIVWMQIRSYLVPKGAGAKLWKWITKQNFMGRWLPEGFEFHYGYLGEYPWGDPFRSLDDSTKSKYSSDKVPVTIIPTAHTLTSAPGFDSYHNGSFNLLLPNEIFFEPMKIKWNGLGGYSSKDGQLIFSDPTLNEPGPWTFLGDIRAISDFLQKQQMDIVWTVLGEKQIITPGIGMSTPGRAEFSRSHYYNGSTFQSSDWHFNHKLYTKAK